MKKVELLLPAGNVEKMEYAINYGADAVYLGFSDYSLRSMKSGDTIKRENLKFAIETAHKLGAKAYFTMNIYAHNSNINSIIEDIELIKEAKPDAVIFSDFGIFNLLKRVLSEMPLHVSTQANTLNYEAVKFWQNQGVQRVILARELSISEIAEIKQQVPDMELESFVHGSQCVSLSGRCLLSDYMTKGERKANQGACAQPCRWNYKLLEENRPGEYYEIGENEHGTFILSPKDLMLIEHIHDLIKAGVNSVKIEGRTKSMYYAAAVARAYRRVIDSYYEESSKAFDYVKELSKVSNRGYTKGFLLGKPSFNEYRYETSNGVSASTFLGIIIEKPEKVNGNVFKVKAKNKISLGETVEIITPKSEYTVKISKILNQYEEETDVAKTNEEALIWFETDELISDWNKGIIRTV